MGSEGVGAAGGDAISDGAVAHRQGEPLLLERGSSLSAIEREARTDLHAESVK